MSTTAAIDVMIRLQLLADNRLIAYANWFKAPQAAAGGQPAVGGYGYDKKTMLQFLADVADRLKRDDPPRTFAWRTIDIDQCLDADHRMLIRLIADQIADESRSSAPTGT